jgi:hypothetical protein
MSEAEELRIRQPTERGTEHFLEQVQKHKDKIKAAWATVQKELDVDVDNNYTSLAQLNLSIDFKFRKFRRLCFEYLDFLDRTRTEDSMRRLREFSQYTSDCENEVQLKLQDLAYKQNELDDSKSVHSKSSRKSKRSSISTSSSLAANIGWKKQHLLVWRQFYVFYCLYDIVNNIPMGLCQTILQKRNM